MQRRQSKILKVPGRLIVNPVDAFYGDPQFPFGGTEVGAARLCALTPTETDRQVWYECFGEPGDVIEGGSIWNFSCILRGWDDDAVELLLSDAQVLGEVSQRQVIDVPGNKQAGTSGIPRGVRLAYVPDDPLHVPGLMIYRAIPDHDGALDFQRAAEFGLPLSFTCIRDDVNRILSVGMMADLSPV